MARPLSSPSMITKARELLLQVGPMSAGDLARELEFQPGAFGRQLSMFGEDLGLLRSSEIRKGKLVWIWDADPNWIPPKSIKTAPVLPLTPEQRAERESADRLAENLRRFRQEQPRYAGGRRNA